LKLNKKLACICVVSVVLALSTSVTLAAPSVSLSWYKNNGYSDFGNSIGGEWTITAEVSSDVTRVEFYVDDALQQNVTSAPFKWAFNTADFSLGDHNIKAIAYDSAGNTATAQADRKFVEYSAEDTLLIIIVVVVTVMVIILIAALYRVRKK
jgi:hypothetical protein